MSLLSGGLKGALGGFAKGGVAGAITGGLGGLFGNGSDINIARNLSAEVGCTIAQSNANQARALIAKGIDPCTGQPKTGGVGIPGAPVPGINDPRFTFNQPQPPRQPIPVFDTPMVTGPGGTQMQQRSGSSGLEYTTTGLIKNVVVNGRRVSRRNAAAFIRKAGIEVGARGLLLTVQQAAQVVLQQATRPRRRRGISGAQITQARRVMNTISSFQKQLGCTTRRVARRKPSCR